MRRRLLAATLALFAALGAVSAIACYEDGGGRQQDGGGNGGDGY